MGLFKSFKQIDEEALEVVSIFSGANYLAHKHPKKDSETLLEHTVKAKAYFLRVMEHNRLESLIDRIVGLISLGSGSVGNFIKELFFYSIVFHDFGKVNPNFQHEKMNNPFFTRDNSIKIGSEHSFLSAYLFLNYCVEKIAKGKFSNEERSLAYACSFLFSTPMLKHHSGHIEKNYSFSEIKTDSVHFLTEMLGVNITEQQVRKLIEFESADSQLNLWVVFRKVIEQKNFNFFALFALLKLNYSLLTASDYLATSEYMNDLTLVTEEHFGLLTESLKVRLIHNFDNNIRKPFNGQLLRGKDRFLSKSLDELKEKNNTNLNFIRQKLGAEVLTNIQKHQKEKVFYIEAPTGGGKTNMSMIALRKMLELHPEINKVFYVFPFTTLITQTAKAIKETFGLSDDEVALLHSKSGFQTKEYADHNEVDAKYGKEKRNQIDNLFVNYPFVLMTHIKFFDVLKSNKKDTNYVLHRLANSVVIIDELQAYSPDHWDKIKYFIAKYAELFNIRFVIMSATLPKIDEIDLSGYKPKSFIALIPDAKQYLQNPNFAGRVEIRTDLLERKTELQDLAQLVFDKSNEYAARRKDAFGGSVYTIIEFIYKKSASEFYDIVAKKDHFFDEIFLLSGTILEHRRKYIIEFLKDEENRKRKILLVTTQVVEAGVDIDMDLGFKNQSLIDSDEQLAGRINRNVNKKDCELWLFKHDRPKAVYGSDLRYEVTEKQFKPEEVKKTLAEKDFKKLYERVFDEIKKNNASAYKKGLDEYLSNFERFDFRRVHDEFKLIDSQNINVFVPVEVPIKSYANETNFSGNELQFLRRNNCIVEDESVSGEEVWALYSDFMQAKGKRFSIEDKILNGIMSKFVFSLFANKIDTLFRFLENPPTTENHKSQLYFKLKKDDYPEIYSENGGLNEVNIKAISGETCVFL